MLTCLFEEQYGPINDFPIALGKAILNDVTCTARCVVLDELISFGVEKTLQKTAEKVALDAVKGLIKKGLVVIEKTNIFSGVYGTVKCYVDCSKSTSNKSSCIKSSSNAG